MQHLPPGVNLSVPDLSMLKPRPQVKDPIAIKVQPGDRVMVLLPQQATQQEVANVSALLKQWAPQTEFLVLSGPESITVIPALEEIVHVVGNDELAWDPTEAKAPQGQDDVAPRGGIGCYPPVEDDVVPTEQGKDVCYCEGPGSLHRKGAGELCGGESPI